MKAGIIELGGVCLFGLSAIVGFGASQSRQPYNLTEIQFCPQSVNGEKGQAALNKKYCNKRKFVLADEWERYGSYGGVIPYKGDAIMKVRDLPSDNPYQLLGNSIAVMSLWGVTGCLLVRVNRLKKRDYLFNEIEKTENYCLWQEQGSKRELKTHRTKLRTETTKDVESQVDILQRQELGLTDEENEQIKSQLGLEDYLKARDAEHSGLEKQIAENRRDAAKADKEREKIQRKTSSEEDFNTTKNSNEACKKALLQQLKEHDDGWLYSIIKSAKPLWLIGAQGSGKTNTAGAIALIRKYCFDAPIYQLIDRHATGENWDVWKLLDASLKAESEEEIGQALEDATDRWLQRIKEKPKSKQQIIIDEFTNLKKLPSCKEVATLFFSMHLTDTRKAKENFIGVNHYFTNESTVEGTFEARKSGTIQLKKFSADGEVPLSRVQIVHGLVDEHGNELNEVEKTLPSWFEVNKIYEHFNGSPIKFEQ